MPPIFLAAPEIKKAHCSPRIDPVSQPRVTVTDDGPTRYQDELSGTVRSKTLRYQGVYPLLVDYLASEIER